MKGNIIFDEVDKLVSAKLDKIDELIFAAQALIVKYRDDAMEQMLEEHYKGANSGVAYYTGSFYIQQDGSISCSGSLAASNGAIESSSKLICQDLPEVKEYDDNPLKTYVLAKQAIPKLQQIAKDLNEFLYISSFFETVELTDQEIKYLM